VSERFKAQYYVDDGYIGKYHPKHFTIESSEIEDDMDDSSLENLYEECIQEHFSQNIFPCAQKVEKFIDWAKEQISKRDNK